MMNSIAYDKILKMIRSCDFLSQAVIAKWNQNLSKIPESFYPLLLKTIEETINEMDSLYREFELNRDSNNNYRGLINEKSSNVVRLAKSLKLKQASELIWL